MESKKSQMAMEFLFTYGWAILVVLCAVGILVYLGVFNQDSFNNEDTVCAKFCNMKNMSCVRQVSESIICEETINYPNLNLTEFSHYTYKVRGVN